EQRKRRVPAELLEREVEQVAEQRVDVIVSAQVRLMVHLRIDIALQHVDEDVLALLVEDLCVTEIAPPEGEVDGVVLGHPFLRRGNIVEEIRRTPRNDQDRGLKRAV